MNELRSNIIINLQAMDNACIRTNGLEFLAAAKSIEEDVDSLIALLEAAIADRDRLIERLQKVEAIRFQEG